MGNILINVHRDTNQDDLEVVVNGETTERKGLYKELPDGFENRSLFEILQYMCNPESDDVNEAYNIAETDIANKIRPLINDRIGTQIYGMIDGELNEEEPLDLSLTLNDYAPGIYVQKAMNINGEPTQYKFVELIASKLFAGGCHGKI
jgi:hypothetical protein